MCDYIINLNTQWQKEELLRDAFVLFTGLLCMVI